MKSIFLALLVTAAGLTSGSLSASPVCPVTASTNTDCGFIITIGATGGITGAAVAGAAPYDGADDALIGIVNASRSTFTGSITLTGSGNGGGLFDFEGDGICTYAAIVGSAPTSAFSYCSASQQAGTDPGDYAGPLNTFSNILTTSVFEDTGTVNITGLAAGASTFFSVEGSPASFGTPIIIGGTPEPGTVLLLGSGLAVIGYFRKRRSI